MRRLQERDLSLGTVKERNAPESLTPIRARPKTATCSVDSQGAALDQVGLRGLRAWTNAYLLIARVESEAGKSQAKSYPSSFRGAPLRREPGIHNHHREYGFRACASKSAVADLDNDIAELG